MVKEQIEGKIEKHSVLIQTDMHIFIDTVDGLQNTVGVYLKLWCLVVNCYVNHFVAY